MRLVLDASVAVASERPLESGHAAARARIVRVLAGEDEVVVPPIFAAEVAGALVRRGHAEPLIVAFVTALTSSPHRVEAFGPRASRGVVAAALRGRLRGADACYAWLAAREDIPLCTLDKDLAARAAAICRVVPP
jgi:predicted nucleic acid-binding protein